MDALYLDDDFAGMEASLTIADFISDAVTYLKSAPLTSDVRTFMKSIGLEAASESLRTGGSAESVIADLEGSVESLTDVISRTMVKSIEEMVAVGLKIIDDNHAAIAVLRSEGMAALEKKFPKIYHQIAEDARRMGKTVNGALDATPLASSAAGLALARETLGKLQRSLPDAVRVITEHVSAYNAALKSGAKSADAWRHIQNANTQLEKITETLTSSVKRVVEHAPWVETVPVPYVALKDAKVQRVGVSFFETKHLREAYSALHHETAHAHAMKYGTFRSVDHTMHQQFYDNITDTIRSVDDGKEAAMSLIHREDIDKTIRAYYDSAKHSVSKRDALGNLISVPKVVPVSAPTPSPAVAPKLVPVTPSAPAIVPVSPAATPVPTTTVTVDAAVQILQRKAAAQTAIAHDIQKTGAATVTNVAKDITAIRETQSLPIRIVVSIFTTLGRLIRWLFHVVTFGMFKGGH